MSNTHQNKNRYANKNGKAWLTWTVFPTLWSVHYDINMVGSWTKPNVLLSSSCRVKVAVYCTVGLCNAVLGHYKNHKRDDKSPMAHWSFTPCVCCHNTFWPQLVSDPYSTLCTQLSFHSTPWSQPQSFSPALTLIHPFHLSWHFDKPICIHKGWSLEVNECLAPKLKRQGLQLHCDVWKLTVCRSFEGGMKSNTLLKRKLPLPPK